MEILDQLAAVQKPARYIGKECNSIKKKWTDDKIKIVISYPDIYEIGMSNQGLSILYNILNFKKDILCERCFAPWKDMQILLKEKKQTLYSLESKKPLDEFDLVAFTLQHELNYTNILTILSLGNLEIWQKNRNDKHPIIIGGGPCTLNPEPVADFFDCFLIGDAERDIFRIIKKIKSWKKNKKSRTEVLKDLAKIDSVYVPSFYKVSKTKKGIIIPCLDRKVKKATIKNLNSVKYPVKPIVSYIQTVHDRFNIEIMRGCPNACRFCQARIYYGPARIRNKSNIINIAKQGYRNTGYEEICLSSLSSGNYPDLVGLLKEIKKEFNNKYIFINLPSLWVDNNIFKIFDEFKDSKRPGLTFAPEVASRKMRNIIGKFVDENEIIKIINFVLNKVWKKIKLYYMLGLPGLKEDDLLAIKKFLEKLLYLNTRRKVELNISFSLFIPKPHTPFQWVKFESKKTYEKQCNFIRKNFHHKRLNFSIKKYEFSLIEAILSRGDRKVGRVIYKAWCKGAQFDSWDNEFNFDVWQKSFQEEKIDYNKYLDNFYDESFKFPWDYIYTGVRKMKLWESYKQVEAMLCRQDIGIS